MTPLIAPMSPSLHPPGNALDARTKGERKEKIDGGDGELDKCIEEKGGEGGDTGRGIKKKSREMDIEFEMKMNDALKRRMRNNHEVRKTWRR